MRFAFLLRLREKKPYLRGRREGKFIFGRRWALGREKKVPLAEEVFFTMHNGQPKRGGGGSAILCAQRGEKGRTLFSRFICRWETKVSGEKNKTRRATTDGGEAKNTEISKSQGLERSIFFWPEITP